MIQTDGHFESCTSVAEGNEDALYVIVKRTVNARTVRLHTRLFARPDAAFFVDCGVTYHGKPTRKLTGLHHLEGKTVSLLADGAVMPTGIVANGTVILEHPARHIQVGLPITADLQTLPLALQMEALGQGHTKNINQVALRVHESAGIFVGPTFARLTEVKQRTTEPYGISPALKSAELPVAISPAWQRDGALCVRQSDPLPLTILSMTLEVALGR